MDEFNNRLDKVLYGDTTRIIVGSLIFAGTILLVLLLYRYLVRKIKQKTILSPGNRDNFLLELIKVPALCLLIWIIFQIFIRSTLFDLPFYRAVNKLGDIMLILLIGWILIKCTRFVFYRMEKKLNNAGDTDFTSRGNLTKLKIFEGIIIGLIGLLVVAACLMSFEKVRAVGLSLLTSAGIAGIILGLAAQKSIGMILAGIQVAITQPIRLNDVVVVQGEWGRIEEITLTYVVIKIWDERRIIIPVTFFLEQSFYNWTRNSTNIMGTVFLYVDYSLPIAPLREYLLEILADHPQWDKRAAKIQVTDMKPGYTELRVLLSASNSSFNWDLRVFVREKLIAYIDKNHPDSLVKIRFSSSDENHESQIVSNNQPGLFDKTDSI